MTAVEWLYRRGSTVKHALTDVLGATAACGIQADQLADWLGNQSPGQRDRLAWLTRCRWCETALRAVGS